MSYSSNSLLTLFVSVGAMSISFAPSTYANTQHDDIERNFEIVDEVVNTEAEQNNEVISAELNDESDEIAVDALADVEVVTEEEFAGMTADEPNTDTNEMIAGVGETDAATDSQVMTNESNSEESFEVAEIVSISELDENRGTSNPISASYAFATNSGNSSNGSVSEGNQIAGNAFANTSGIATSIQNSGNNVIIQSSTIVNVDFSSAPVPVQ
jgi:hypothetical protein